MLQRKQQKLLSMNSRSFLLIGKKLIKTAYSFIYTEACALDCA